MDYLGVNKWVGVHHRIIVILMWLLGAAAITGTLVRLLYDWGWTYHLEIMGFAYCIFQNGLVELAMVILILVNQHRP